MALPIIEVDYYNCIWNKRVLTPQPERQTNNVVVPGSSGSAATNVWPINNVYAPPMTYTATGFPAAPMTPGTTNPRYSVVKENFFTEDMYIRGGFNNAPMDLGVRAYLDEEDPLQQHRFNALIYSGIFNSRTGINRTNEFPTGTNITRASNPQYGSIQKIYAEENNLIVLQENKSSRALINKNAIYNAEGGGSVTTSNAVIGEIIPYTGEYGIGLNPESFAIFAYRKYYIDRNRNAVLRLSHDGVTEISEYGMRDFFRDEFANLNDDYTNAFIVDTSITATSNPPSGNQSCISYINNAALPQEQYLIGAKIFVEYSSSGTFEDLNVYVTGFRKNSTNNFILFNRTLPSVETQNVTKVRLETYYRSRVYGGWDAYNKQYLVSIQPNKANEYNNTNGTVPKRDLTYETLGFDEQVKGWPSTYTYQPARIGSLKNKFFTINNQPFSASGTSITQGIYSHYADATPHCQFYGVDNVASVSIVANSQPSIQKNFLTIDYEGMSGWTATVLASGRTGDTASRVAGGAWDGSWETSRDTSTTILSYVQGAYDSAGNTGTTANATNAPVLHAGFDRKENKYMANLINNSTVSPGEISFGENISGIKGFYLDVTFTTDTITAPGQMKELYAISLNYNIASM